VTDGEEHEIHQYGEVLDYHLMRYSGGWGWDVWDRNGECVDRGTRSTWGAALNDAMAACSRYLDAL
jgi:hypothetical protein